MKKLFVFVLFCAVGASTALASSFGEPVGPFGNPVFVRGGMNDWGISDQMTWDSVNEEYTAVLAINAGTWEFKIADEGWGNPDFGAVGDPNIVLGTPTDIGPASFGNFVLELASPGNYLFTFFNIAQDLQSGSLVVSQVVPVPAALVLFGSALAGFGFVRRRKK